MLPMYDISFFRDPLQTWFDYPQVVPQLPAAFKARKMFDGQYWKLLVAAYTPEMFPGLEARQKHQVLSEIAYAGRSNAGKSSLINALTRRTKLKNRLAQTSRMPGRTQSINFFVNQGKGLLTDLPGYGYGKAPGTKLEQWGQLIDRYITTRPQDGNAQLFLLLDSRRGVTSRDAECIAYFEKCLLPYHVVLTKVDKLRSEQEMADAVQNTARYLIENCTIYGSYIHCVSSLRNFGLDELRYACAAALNIVDPIISLPPEAFDTSESVVVDDNDVDEVDSIASSPTNILESDDDWEDSTQK
jgi:GTP-binding protein